MNGTYIFEIVNRTIVPSATEELAVVNDNDSRYITFKIPSVIDGIDITDKILTVRYVNSLNRYDQFFCNTREVIAEGNEQFVLFDWVLSADVTSAKGTVVYDVSIYDTNDISNTTQYILHTKPATLQVEEGLLDIGAPIEDKNALQEAIDSFNATAAKYYNDMLIAQKAAEEAASNAAKSAASLKVDTTLTISGYAADAKTVGDKLAGMASSSDITSLRQDLLDEINESTKYLKGNVWNALEHGCNNTASRDNTAIVQKALDEAENGTVFYFPKGRYLLNTITLKNQKKNIKIIGDGYGWYGGTILQSTSSYSFLVIEGGTHITIENLLIYKYEKEQNTRGIFFKDATPTTMDCRMLFTMVRDVAIQGFRYGIEFAVPSGYNFFDNVRVSEMSENGVGFSIGSQFVNTATNFLNQPIPPNYIYLSRCSLDGILSSNTTGLSISCGQEIFVSDCDICNHENCAVKIFNNNSVSKRAELLFFNRNSIYNNKTGFFIDSNDEKVAINGVNISNNMILGSDTDNGVGIETLKSSAGVKDIKNLNVIGNIMYSFHDTWTQTKINAYDKDTSLILGAGLSQ